jgi:hypothetical protein
MSLPPVVYCGPSLRPEEVRAILPGAYLQPPVARGDLYRDRMLRFSLFVVLDGVFLQHQAVSPREIVEVLDDGAVVIGASSMGALRAAECWPAGMHGVGIIYRLFRAGRLLSDDEVAVTVDPDPPHRALSVPLVNVRYALSKAVRARLISRAEALDVLGVAAPMFYADRTWPRILRAAGLQDEDGTRARFLGDRDLKRDDALRALRRAAAMLAADPTIGMRPRRRARPFVLSEESRERPHDALGSDEPRALKREVCRHAIASGRYTRLLVDLGEARESLGEREDEVVEALWATLQADDRLDEAVYRWRVHRAAVAEAQARGWTAGVLHRFVAEREIAHAHGFPGWPELQAALGRHPALWSWVAALRDDLALAKRVKEALFQEGLAFRGRTG